MSRARLSVIVVGAGAIGLASALALARRGATVRVVEAQPEAPAGGGVFGVRSASAGAAGMLGAFSEALNEPASAHPDAMALRAAGLRAWAAFDRDLGGGLVHPGGAFNVARSEARAAALLDLARVAEGNGARWRYLDAAEARTAIAALSADVCAALYFPEEGRLDVARARAAMARAAAALGVSVVHDHAIGIDRRGGAWRVHGASGRAIEADIVVVAPGAFADAALIDSAPDLAVLRTARGCVIAAPDFVGAATVRAEDVYVAAGGGQAVIGGGMVFDAEPGAFEAALEAHLREAAARLVGVDRGARAWFGARAMTPDWSPMLGRDSQTGVILAAGFARNGWLLAPLAAQRVCALVLDETAAPVWDAFSPDRF